jgi:hypothetical protein
MPTSLFALFDKPGTLQQLPDKRVEALDSVLALDDFVEMPDIKIPTLPLTLLVKIKNFLAFLLGGGLGQRLSLCADQEARLKPSS